MTERWSWGAGHWLLPAGLILLAALVTLALAYRRAPASAGVRRSAALLKAIGIAALAICLLEPLGHGSRARPGANLFVVLADDSESLNARDSGAPRTRGEELRELLRPGAPWRVRLGQDFEVREHAFDARVRAVDGFDGLAFQGSASALGTALESLARRYRDRPLAGILVLTDGIATDLEGRELAAAELPPVYPVLLAASEPPRDLSVRRVAVAETSFENAPVTVQAELAHHGLDGEELVVRLRDAAGAAVEERTVRADGSGRTSLRFELRPPSGDVSFYRVEAAPASTGPAEATLVNNAVTFVAGKGRGPFRILYVAGRPAWELKFLRRALAEDDEVDLVALIRIARREPKFDFRGRDGGNPLFQGFKAEGQEGAERYDQPVLLRLDTVDEDELRDGFPRSAAQLFRYDALILDDVEAEYFTADQLALVRDFVARRGGGLLMLGGDESFARGKYARTPIAELLPVYLDAPSTPAPAAAEYRFELTREGQNQPWVRLRKTEELERKRLESLPPLRTLNPASAIKPGATVLARVTDGKGGSWPALVEQRFGKGRAAAIPLGDLWRWGLRRRSPDEDDLATAWRQTLRWLVAEVPRRVEAAIEPGDGATARLAVRVRDAEHRPLENASVAIRVTGPDGGTIDLAAAASDSEAGLYVVEHRSRLEGPHRAQATVRAPDGSPIETRTCGWVAEPAALERRELAPDRALFERIARQSGGEVVARDGLEAFVASLPARRAPVTDPWTFPLWHQWPVLAIAVACLAGEWALRRAKGLP